MVGITVISVSLRRSFTMHASAQCARSCAVGLACFLAVTHSARPASASLAPTLRLFLNVHFVDSCIHFQLKDLVFCQPTDYFQEYLTNSQNLVCLQHTCLISLSRVTRFFGVVSNSIVFTLKGTMRLIVTVIIIIIVKIIIHKVQKYKMLTC